MGVLPPTGNQIIMGRVAHAYNNVGQGGQSVSFGNSATRPLNPYIGFGATQQTFFSANFGGRITPYTY